MSDETDVAQPSASAEPAGDKLDQIINSSIDTVEAQDTAPPDEGKTEQGERLRDERGRFASKEPAEAEPSETEPAKAEATPATEQPAEPAPQPLEPHARWSEADKAKFAAAPRDIQEWMLERQKATDGEYTRKTQELAEQRKSIEPLIGEVQRLNPLLQHLGMSPQQFMVESANVAHNLLSGTPQQRAQAVAYLVNLHHVPPDAVVQALGIPLHSGEDGQQAADPRFANVSQELTQLRSQIASMQQQAQDGERQRAKYEFDSLAHAKDESGQAKYPHFTRVSQTMLQLAANGQADTWEAAYTKAVRLDDDLHKEIIEAAAKREREAVEKAQQEAVEKARKAQPVRSSNALPRGDTAKKGLDAHIDAALSRMGVA